MVGFNSEKKYPNQLMSIFKIFILLVIFIGMGQVFFRNNQDNLRKARQQIISTLYGSPPLIMGDGDPHIRALMRTISSSEANYVNPYNIVYGGYYTDDLTKHPNRCILISTGPNKGDCSTASGRYQFLNTTWYEKSRLYHPQSSINNKKNYSFEAIYQDKVLYAWLTDSEAWEKDILTLLKEDKIEEVLELLSPTWTSLGYGIEDNVMTKHLPKIYRKLLAEELKAQSEKNDLNNNNQDQAPVNN